MGTWRITAEALANARFVISPLAEVVGALGDLAPSTGRANPVVAATYGAAFSAMLRKHPGRAAVVEHCAKPGWMADFLAIPPAEGSTGFDDELRQVQSLGDAAIRADLRRATPTTLPNLLLETGLTAHVTGLLGWVWTHAVEADWPRRKHVLEADIVARVARLAAHGYAGVLKDIGRGRQWAGNGEMRINEHSVPTRHLPPNAQLCFVPVHSQNAWVGWQGQDRYAIYYPVTGSLAPTSRTTPTGLDQLIGRSRGRLLRAIDAPTTTTSLATRTGLALGSVGDHLTVMLHSGLLLRRRSGREVFYWRTELGEQLVATSTR